MVKDLSHESSLLSHELSPSLVCSLVVLVGSPWLVLMHALNPLALSFDSIGK